jgi:hypothetical protein
VDLVLNGELNKGNTVCHDDAFVLDFIEKWYMLEKRRVMIIVTVKMVQTHSL